MGKKKTIKEIEWTFENAFWSQKWMQPWVTIKYRVYTLQRGVG